MGMLTETPHNKLPIQKMATALSSTGLRPKISEILPHVGTNDAFPSRYALPTQMYPRLELKCADMVGTAVVMMVTSRAARKSARHNAKTMRKFSTFVRSASGSVV